MFAFRPSVLTYQLSLYQHKQIYANLTLVVDGAGSTGGSSRSTSGLTAANSSQIILSMTLFHEWFKLVRLDMRANVKTLVGI